MGATCVTVDVIRVVLFRIRKKLAVVTLAAAMFFVNRMSTTGFEIEIVWPLYGDRALTVGLTDAFAGETVKLPL